MRPIPTYDDIVATTMLHDGPPSLAAWVIVPQTGSLALIIGESGFGKTALGKMLATVAARRYFGFYGDQSIPEDFGGYKKPGTWHFEGADIEVMRSIADERFVQACLVDSVILFDEVTCCPEDVQAAMLSIACDPPPRCWPLAAANDPVSAANGHNLTKPMTNRVWQAKMTYDWEAWEAGQRADRWPCRQLPILPGNWHDFYEKWGELSVLFRREHPECLGREQLESGAPDWDGTAFPSPRAWTNACRALAGCDSVGGNGDVRQEILKGFVGAKAANQFWAWLSSQKIPDVSQLLEYAENGDRAFVLGALRKLHGSHLLVVASGVVNETVRLKGKVDNNTYAARWTACQSVLVGMSEVGYEEIAQLVYNRLFVSKDKDGNKMTHYPSDGFEHRHTVLDANRAQTCVWQHKVMQEQATKRLS